ncbi:MAG: aspartate-semialdehyde dehydrogenase [Spirochaetales bacterium]|nr:MAG: aspartate-semialdehyde dehydrogenase [Spirochaetales bacterium]
MKPKIPVAILGATGTVGQKFITLLQDHPWFEIRELAASPRSAGKPYAEACSWKQDVPIPRELAGKTVLEAGEKLQSRILFSGMDASVAGPIEENYASEGYAVVSNAKNFRTHPLVPIIIPEVNADHFEITRRQPWKGSIVTNSNCVIMPAALVLSPLMDAFGLEWVQLTSMQAVSGAGYPGVPSYDILGNVIPFIGGEEPKVESEGQKILGSLDENGITPAPFVLSAQCNRVPVIDGHTENLSIKFKQKPAPQDVKKVLSSWKSMPQQAGLPSAPEHPVVVFSEENRPQPARDIWTGKGMSACAGRIRECPIGDIKMVVMGHNTVRGAAGAAILNAEAFVHLGYLD